MKQTQDLEMEGIPQPGCIIDWFTQGHYNRFRLENPPVTAEFGHSGMRSENYMTVEQFYCCLSRAVYEMTHLRGARRYGVVISEMSKIALLIRRRISY